MWSMFPKEVKASLHAEAGDLSCQYPTLAKTCDAGSKNECSFMLFFPN